MQSRREFQPSPPAQARDYEYFSSEEIKTFHDILLRRSKSKDFENNTWKTYRSQRLSLKERPSFAVGIPEKLKKIKKKLWEAI